MDNFFLKILMWVIAKVNSRQVNFDQLKVICETKLKMDKRRTPVSWKKRQQKETSNSMLISFFIYGLMGLFVGSQVLLIPSLIFSMIIFHSYLLFMMAMTLITDFSAVLLDTSDNQILVPKPINSRTLFVARAVHITIYLLQYFIVLAIFPIIFTFIQYGLLVGLAVIFTALLTVVFAIFTTYLLYGLILRFGNEEKIKEVVGYFQIFMTVVFVGGFQIVPRLMDFSKDFTFTPHIYTYFIPAAWMAFFLEGIQLMKFDSIHLIMTACAFLVPLLSFYVMMKYLAPSFARKLSAMGNATANSVQKVNPGRKKFSLLASTVSFICDSNEERAGYEQVWRITGRDKTFKIGFYPSIAYLFIFLLVTVFKGPENMGTQLAALPNSKSFLFFIYLPVFIASGALYLIPYYENFAAGWIYQAAPLHKPGSLISGGLKAIIVKFFLPFFVLMFAISLYVWGWRIIDDFALGFFNDIFIFYLLTVISDYILPFSQKPAVKQQAGKFARAMLQMLMIGSLVGLHYLALKVSWLPVLLVILPATGIYLLQKKLTNISWLKIKI